MIHASAMTESIVAPTLFRPAFSHSLGYKRTFANNTENVRLEAYSRSLLKSHRVAIQQAVLAVALAVGRCTNS